MNNNDLQKELTELLATSTKKIKEIHAKMSTNRKPNNLRWRKKYKLWQAEYDAEAKTNSRLVRELFNAMGY